MVDRQFADGDLASLYDLSCGWGTRGDFDFYLPLLLAAPSVLDVGCGTGALLHGAREAGHLGRLCGLDPGEGMLAQARRYAGVEWILGDLGSVTFHDEFDLVVMTGHAFQVLVDDEELRGALRPIRSALTGHGRFAFETRNPAARAWEQWTPDRSTSVTTASGAVVGMAHEVELPLSSDLVSFTTTFTCPGWDAPRQSRSTLRFLDRPRLASFLSAAGLAVDRQYGDWDGSPLTAVSPEIITIARRA